LSSASPRHQKRKNTADGSSPPAISRPIAARSLAPKTRSAIRAHRSIERTRSTSTPTSPRRVIATSSSSSQCATLKRTPEGWAVRAKAGLPCKPSRIGTAGAGIARTAPNISRSRSRPIAKRRATSWFS